MALATAPFGPAYWEKILRFGVLELKAIDVIYRAATDGLVIVWHGYFFSDTWGQLLTDSATPPTAIRGRVQWNAALAKATMTVPVRRGDYWIWQRMAGAELPSVGWMPLTY